MHRRVHYPGWLTDTNSQKQSMSHTKMALIICLLTQFFLQRFALKHFFQKQIQELYAKLE